MKLEHLFWAASLSFLIGESVPVTAARSATPLPSAPAPRRSHPGGGSLRDEMWRLPFVGCQSHRAQTSQSLRTKGGERCRFSLYKCFEAVGNCLECTDTRSLASKSRRNGARYGDGHSIDLGPGSS